MEEIHSKFTDRRPNGIVRIGLGITMSLKWIQERVKRLVGLLERESAAPAYFRVARTSCVRTPDPWWKALLVWDFTTLPQLRLLQSADRFL